MLSRSSILNFGSLNIDYVYRVPHIVRLGETLNSHKLSISAGGKGANQSSALAKAGVPVFHAGQIGNDGLWVKETLAQCGVHTEMIRCGPLPTGAALIQLSDAGDNAIILSGGANRALDEQYVLSTLSLFHEGDWLLLQNETNLGAFIIEQASQRGLSVCFNPAPYSTALEQFPLDLVSILILNETEGEALSHGERDPERMMNHLVSRLPQTEIILTLGAIGSLYGKGPERISLGIIKGPVVDTTAAGDTFVGYYLSERALKVEASYAMTTATQAASLAIAHAGAMATIPWKKELTLARRPPQPTHYTTNAPPP